ncbi:MAG: hypothetical protein VX400_02520, partial [Pseudomonadota bacterium]|nr:hypothetical protein [Pseudomonadota bacterium]
LSLTDIGAFFIQSLLDDAGNSRAHFGVAHGLDASGQLENIVEVGRGHRHRAHRDRLPFLRCIGRRTGRSEETEAKKEQGANWRHDFSLGCDSPATGGSSRLAFLQF